MSNKQSAAASFLNKNAKPYHDTETKDESEERILELERRITELEEKIEKINFIQQELILSSDEIHAVISEIMSLKK